MARSLKKGPFADKSLLKKIDEMNSSGSKQVITEAAQALGSIRPGEEEE